MARIIALAFAAAAVFRLWRDWGATVDAGDAFEMVTLGVFWGEFSPSSLARVQEFATGFLSAGTQASILNVPFAALLLILAALFWFLGRGPAPKRKQFGR